MDVDHLTTLSILYYSSMLATVVIPTMQGVARMSSRGFYKDRVLACQRAVPSMMCAVGAGGFPGNQERLNYMPPLWGVEAYEQTLNSTCQKSKCGTAAINLIPSVSRVCIIRWCPCLCDIRPPWNLNRYYRGCK